MEKVYYFTLKNKNEILNKLIIKDNSVYEFYVNQTKSDDEFVSQYISLRKGLWDIDINNDLLDEMIKTISNTVNLPQDRGSYALIESQNLVGKYYNRIYRPVIKEPTPQYFNWGFRTPHYAVTKLQEKVFAKKLRFPMDELGLLSSLNQLSILTNSLHSLFQTIHPDKNCLEIYGHSIRNLLILACTEVETQLKGILLNNGYPKKKSLNTKDYIKLNDVLALSKYRIKLDYYPLLEELSPFQNWDFDKPTESLSWYSNYNATKHDRENKINCGCIKNVLNAIAAVAILIRAQYGEQDVYWKEHIGGFFTFIELPNWKIEEKYIPPVEGERWRSVNFFISS